jgi:type I restriction enzyme S subunit
MTLSGASSVYPVPRGWKPYVVDQIKSSEPHACVAGPFGSKISAKYFTDEGVPVVRGSNLRDDLTRFVPENFVFVSHTKAGEYRPQHIVSGDLVFTCWGTIGQVGIIPEDSPYPSYIISNKQLKLRVNRYLADPLFCFYYFASPRYVEHIRNRSIGGAVPGINLGILKSFSIALPTLPIQKRIAQHLGSYDELIENNRRRTALLEQAARLLYREWFVYLRFPGHEHTRISDGVPEGWQRAPLGEHVILNYGKALKAEDRVDGPFPVYGSSGVVGSHEKPLVQGPGIILGRKGNVGSVYWSAKDFYPIDTVYFIDRAMSNLYLYYSIKDMHFINTDVAVPGLNRDLAYSRPLLLPADTILRDFLEIVSPIHEQIGKLSEINEKLSTARDLVLPRLMSGEIAL